MGQTNFLKIISAVAFIALASWSCWATEASLHLLLPNIPQFLLWLIVIAFFILASYGTKMIVDSLNQNIYMERRGSKLVFGILITFLFWLCFSMPTNTHTFFFKNAVSDVATEDITTTSHYLTQLANNEVTEKEISDAILKLKSELDGELNALEKEIMNPQRPGDGTIAKDIRSRIAKVLGIAEFHDLGSTSGKSKQALKQLSVMYRDAAYDQFELTKKNLRDLYMSKGVSEKVQEDSRQVLNNLQIAENAIKNNELDLNDADELHALNQHLSKGYALISNTNVLVSFKNESDKIRYTDDSKNTQITKLLSVWDVWVSYLKGTDFRGRGMLLWILLSVLVDLGAFLFFDLTFKKDEYSI